MAWVYILRSNKNGRLYIGSTIDIERRLKEHQSGLTQSLKYLLPLDLVFKQRFENVLIARRVELKLKKLKRRDYLEKIIKDGYLKMGT